MISDDPRWSATLLACGRAFGKNCPVTPPVPYKNMVNVIIRWLNNQRLYLKKIDFLFIIDYVSSFLEYNLSFGFF